jgi:NTE family protein
MHDIISNVQLDEKMKESIREIEKEYHKLAYERGAIIKKITRIERTEDVHFLFEVADFSINTIKKLIEQGEIDAESALATK